MATKDATPMDLDQTEREYILMALDNQISVFERKRKAERNPDIRDLVERDLLKVQTISSKFRYSGVK